MCLFNCQLQDVLGPIYQGDELLSIQYGGVLSLNEHEFLLASAVNPIIYWIKDNLVVSSFQPQHLLKENVQWQCCGLSGAMNHRDGFLLVVNSDGLVKLLRFSIDMERKRMFQQPALTPMMLSQRMVPYIGSSSTPILEWGETPAIDSYFHLGLYADNTTFLNYFSQADVGPAIVEYPPMMCMCGTKLIIALNHYQFFSLRQHHRIGVPADQFKTWESLVSSHKYEEHAWWTMPEESRIHAITIMRYPVFISSLITIDPFTFRVEGISHVGSQAFGRRFTDAGKYFIQGIAARDQQVEIALQPLRTVIPRNLTAWAEMSFIDYLEEFGDDGHLFRAFLRWWNNYHLPLTPSSWLHQPVETNIQKSAVLSLADLVHYTRKTLTLSVEEAGLPYTTLDPFKAFSPSSLTNTAISITSASLIKYVLVHHELHTLIDDEVVAKGHDIQVGAVTEGMEKIVKVRLYNRHPTHTMEQITLQLMANAINPAYLHCMLSATGTAWFSADTSIGLASSLAPSQFTEFYVKLDASVSTRRCVPIQIQVLYDLTW